MVSLFSVRLKSWTLLHAGSAAAASARTPMHADRPTTERQLPAGCIANLSIWCKDEHDCVVRFDHTLGSTRRSRRLHGSSRAMPWIRSLHRQSDPIGLLKENENDLVDLFAESSQLHQFRDSSSFQRHLTKGAGADYRSASHRRKVAPSFLSTISQYTSTCPDHYQAYHPAKKAAVRTLFVCQL